MKTRGRGVRRPTQWVAGSLLMLSSTAAMALGLGQIQVKSRPGQPLLAEIPIISNVAGELDGATARLAPPDVFARVGLEPPRGVVGGLQFDIVPNAQGRMVVRVTSSEPVSAQALSFLVEVDWGKGRLVREYSALVDAPQTAAALAEPQIQAPTAVPSDIIERQPEVAQEHLPPAVADSRPQARPVAAPAAPVPAAHPRRPAVAQPAVAASASEWTVRQGQTLSQIARRLGPGDATLDQTMLALLHANPEAFVGGNINRLRTGSVLRVPGQDERTSRTASEASALVREQVAQWRQAGKPVMQPAEPSGPVGSADASAAPVHRATTTAKAPASARLEIAPAAARDGQKAGNQSGIAAGGKGDTLMNEQLRQAKEDLASRDAEIQELRSRVAELEKLQQDQQKLISLKDNELASAQKHLAEPASVTAAKPAPAAHPAAVAPAKTATPAPAAPAEVSGTPFWMWGGAGLVLLGLIGVWVRQRRARKAGDDAQRPRFDIDALAPAAASAAPVADAEPADGFGPAADEDLQFQDDERPETGADAAPLHDDFHDAEPVADAVPLHEAADAADEGLADAQPAAHAEDEPRHAWLAKDAAPVEPSAAVDAAPDDGLHEEPSVADVVPAIDMADSAPAELAEDVFEREAPSFAATHEPVSVDETQAHADAVDEAQDMMQPAVQAEPLIEPVFTDEPAPSAVSDAQAPAEVEPAPSMPEPGESTASKPAPSVADAVAGGGDGLADRERLDLAIAYLDMGDTETAREMLEEAKASRDPQVRGEAEQLLREIG